MARTLGMLIHSALSGINRPRSENARHAKRAWRRHGHKFSFSKLVLWHDQLNRFQQVLEKNGVIDLLREAGVRDGDTVEIYGFSFDFYY